MKAINRAQLWLLGSFLLLAGLWLTAGGAWLAGLGGSLYYVLAGIACIASAVLLLRRRKLGGWIYFVLLVATAIWGVQEAGLDFWLLFPRIIGPLAFGVYLAMPWIWRQLDPAGAASWRVTGGVVALAALFVAGVYFVPERDAAYAGTASAAASPAVNADASDWPVTGRTAAGTRYSPATQITPANVGALKVAWDYRTGDLPRSTPGRHSAQMFEATPIKIGDTLYVCTPHNIVVALDADTGRQLWRYDPKVNTDGVPSLACRGVTYFETKPDVPAGDCPRRILVATLDARMLALDARTGTLCRSFGGTGEISLLAGMGHVKPGYYYVTSPPAIVGGAAVVGGFVFDNRSTDEPPGAVRAFDAVTGRHLWSWDAGAPAGASATLVRGSPNAWSLFSVDEKLGLVYIPTGGSTPDHFGGMRSPLAERYSSSVVALDGKTGQRRWSFQTVHHDIWDYDVASQPVLIDLPIGGVMVPALVQPTKQGELYLLDRRTGTPLSPVEERPVPKGNIPGERYAPTQPFSVGMPTIGPRRLREADMWGASPLDQLWCRIQFRKLHYEGQYTAPSTRPTLVFPGNNGIMNWGSVAIDEARKIMLVNSSYMPLLINLFPIKQGPPGDGIVPQGGGAAQSMEGTPYGVKTERPFMSLLGIPCTAPPWGEISAVDLNTRKILWKRPLGTTRDHAPFGIAVPGVFNMGGSVVTAGGVAFIGAAMDDYLRAFDVATGRELWKGRLPAGGQATPMTYVSRRTGKQLVVIAAGGHQYMKTTIGDHIIAFSLPD